MTAIVGPPRRTEIGISAVSTARPRSARNIIRLRSLRSAIAPATMPKNRSGRVCSAPTTPIASPEPVRARTSSGRAVKLTASPSAETPCDSQEHLEVAVGRQGLGIARDPRPGRRRGIVGRGHDPMVREGPRVRRMAGVDAICRGRRDRRRGPPAGRRGLISAGEGNLSIRLDEARLLVTPTGRRKDELVADDLVIVPSDDAVTDLPRSRSGLAPRSDLAIHLAVHRARPDLGAVVHAHLPAAMALTLGRRGPRPDRAARDGTPPAAPALRAVRRDGQRGARRPRSRSALDGAATVARGRAARAPRRGRRRSDPATAVDRLELVEVLCRTWRDALLVRAARSRLDRAGIVGTPTAPEAPGRPRATKEDG